MRTDRPAAAIFLSALLLFLVQPLLARAILPWFGGGAAVWTTCALFFQVGLLGGYLYAHLLVRHVPPRTQGKVHLALLALSLLALPILPGADWAPHDASAPIGRILLLLAACVGLPYAVLSATSPLLSAWYARRTGDPMPYWLYAVSNAASLLSLLLYPLLLEPLLPLGVQGWVWSAGYGLFVLLCGLLAWDVGRAPQEAPAPAAPVAPAAGDGAAGEAADPAEDDAPSPRSHQLLWLALSAVTSGLLLAVTAHLTQNVAPVPFLWVLPLALYLLSFILCFARGGTLVPRLPALLLAPVVVGAMAWSRGQDSGNAHLGLLVPLFAGGLLLACLAAHRELVRLRPHPRHLTGYYLLTSLGGALGAVLVAVGAPVLLSAELELPLLLGALLVLLPLAAAAGRGSLLGEEERLSWLVLVAFGLCAGGVLVLQGDVATEGARRVERNFYGVLHVTDAEGTRMLGHGTITHGEQLLDAAGRRTATTYYGPGTGIGRVLREAAARPGPRPPGLHVGVVGLGAGTLAAYGRAGDRYRFYELNPLVERLAREEFTYLSDTPARVDVVLGDARLSLSREPPRGFDVLAVDAFSSDAVPTHLLTREALALYLHHLAPDGVLAVHVSNRHLDLAPVVELGARALGAHTYLVDTDDPADTAESRVYAATWVLVTRDEAWAGAKLLSDAQHEVAVPEGLSPWTDDYSNLLAVVDWGG